MTIINLRKYYYPIYKKDTFVEVPDEMAEAFLLLLRHLSEVLSRNCRSISKNKNGYRSEPMSQLEEEKQKVETELWQFQIRQKILLNKQHLEQRGRN